MSYGELIIALILFAILVIQCVNTSYQVGRINAISSTLHERFGMLEKTLWDIHQSDHDRRWEVVKHLSLIQLSSSELRDVMVKAYYDSMGRKSR